MNRRHKDHSIHRRLLPWGALGLLVLGSGCAKEATADGTSRASEASATSEAVTPTSANLDVCAALTTDAVGEAVGIAINDTARLFGNDDPRACAYYRGKAATDQGYAVSVITSPDNGTAVFGARCSGDAVPVDRGDDACLVGGNDLIVLRGSGYVEVAIGILIVDLPDDTAYGDAAVAVYDALEPSL